jgi:hypothetical protein
VISVFSEMGKGDRELHGISAELSDNIASYNGIYRFGGSTALLMGTTDEMSSRVAVGKIPPFWEGAFSVEG